MQDWSIIAPVIVATLASVAFTGLYGFRSKWRINPVGRLQLFQSLSLSAVLVLVLINTILPNYFLRDEIRHVVYWTLAIALCWAVRTLLLVQAGKIRGPNYGRRCGDYPKKTPTDPHGLPTQMRK